MRKRISIDEMVALVGGDRDLVYLLIEESIVVADAEGFDIADVDRVLASHTLLRELEVNAAGVEIILRMRDQLAVALRRIRELERKGGGQ